MANKLKSHSGAKKRFKITGSGKIVSKKEGNNHLLTNKGKTNKKFSYGKELTGASSKMIKSLLH
ncbi:MAG: 50S ribosomal protein L35 [Candidatus Peribacteria bacterium]|jgi:large subunit ribosomal protein L35|nr:50S ribosomal protein L35 [Candidatus Peribacteria bacterium]